MRVNVENMLRLAGQDAGGAFRHSLPELAANLKELRDRSRTGDGQAALNEFFLVYVFGDDQRAQVQHSEGDTK